VIGTRRLAATLLFFIAFGTRKPANQTGGGNHRQFGNNNNNINGVPNTKGENRGLVRVDIDNRTTGEGHIGVSAANCDHNKFISLAVACSAADVAAVPTQDS